MNNVAGRAVGYQIISDKRNLVIKMLTAEINPFIRFARELAVQNSNGDVLTYDHRLFYVTTGECRIKIENIEYPLQSGSVVLLKSGTVYGIEVDKPIKIISLNFDYTQDFMSCKEFLAPVRAEDFRTDRVLERPSFSDADELNRPIVLSGVYEIQRLLDSILAERKKNIRYADELSSAILKTIILRILRMMIFSSSTAYDKAMRVIRYIEENYRADITNEDLAEVSGYHPYHLNRLMKRYTNCTMHRYLMNYRLKKSQELLVNTTLTISEIAEECGFKTAYYFSNRFKEAYGCSPLNYRHEQKDRV